MSNAQYLPLDGNDSFRGEVVFSTPDWCHILIEGTDAIAVVPLEDVYPI